MKLKTIKPLSVFAKAIAFLLVLSGPEGWSYSLTKFNQSWCVSSFPTSYVAGTFAFTEGTAGDIMKNQSNRTIMFDVPAGFQFNTAGGTYSVTGLSANDITAISITSVTASRITVRLTTSNTVQSDINTITVNCQIAATASGSTGIIYRSGGNLKINKSTSKPTASESLGDLSAYTTMSYSSSTTAQANTSAVPQNIDDVEIIQIPVVIAGTCNGINLTQFNFNTTGCTNAAVDITDAKVYYTGNTNSFSPANLFGTYNAPSGSYTITGTQALMNGTNYFWLCYDVPATAIAGNLLDAQCTSITIDGGVGAKVPTTQSPAGTRTISGTTQFYTRASGNWSDNTNWALSDGGASCSCLPNSTSNVFINAGHLITLDATNTVGFLTIRDNAVLSDDGTSTLTLTGNLTTQNAGKFTATSAWTIGGNLVIGGTGKSTTAHSLTVSGNTTIASAATLTSSATAGNNINLQGQLVLNGGISSGTNGAQIVLNGASAQTISGTNGAITGSGAFTLSTSAKTIATGTTISVNQNTSITGAITVTNNGTYTSTGDITGSVAGSTWLNAANSTLNIEGTLLTTGTLTATASPNTINFTSTGNQTIKSGTYNNLTLSTSGTKTFGGNTIINNTLTISGTAIADAGTNTLNGTGRLVMSGTSELRIAKSGVTVPELTGIYSLTGGTITLNQSGAATQTVKAENYYNLKLDGGNAASLFDLSLLTDVQNDIIIQNRSVITNSGIITVGGNLTYSSLGTSALANDLTVDGTSTFSAGVFNLNAKYFTAGGITLSGGTLTNTSSTIEMADGNWTNNGGTFNTSSGSVLFTGTSAQTIGGSSSTTFNNLTFNNTAAASPQITLNASQTVTGTLTLTAGNTNLNSYTFTLGTSAASTGTLSHTAGWMYGGTFKRWYNTSTVANGAVAGLLPVGSSTDARYLYVNAPSSAPGTGGTISAVHTHSGGLSIVNIDDGGTTLDRRYDAYWTITTGDGLAGGTWNLRTTGTGLSAVNNASVLRITNAAGVSGTAGINAGTTANPQVNRTGLTLAQLSNNFYWGYSQAALPVSLISFKAAQINNSVLLTWETASEENNDYFTLMHADASQQYAVMSTVASQGNSSSIANYNYTDVKPFKGLNYYRLIQTDFDGTQKELSTVAVDFRNNSVINIASPVTHDLVITVSDGFNSDFIPLSIYDCTGRMVHSQVIETSSSQLELRIPCSHLNNGVYFLILGEGEDGFRAKFLKD